MKNFLIGILFLIIFSLIFYLLYDKKKENAFSFNTCQPLECDLNLKDCIFPFKNNQVIVSTYPKPIKIFNKTAIKIKNFPYYPKLKIKIYSLNSYIGDIIPKFTINQDEITLNFLGRSITDDSRFRVELLNDDTPTGFFFDFDVIMQENINP